MKIANVAAKLNGVMTMGLPYRVVRVRRKVSVEAKALLDVFHAAWQLVDGNEPAPPARRSRKPVDATLECYEHEIRDLRLALQAAARCMSAGPKEKP